MTMPKSLKKRLDTYHAQTAPLSHYYRKKGLHKATDGMAPIDSVTEAIGALLAAPTAREKDLGPQARDPRCAWTASGRP